MIQDKLDIQDFCVVDDIYVYQRIYYWYIYYTHDNELNHIEYFDNNIHTHDNEQF